MEFFTYILYPFIIGVKIMWESFTGKRDNNGFVNGLGCFVIAASFWLDFDVKGLAGMMVMILIFIEDNYKKGE